ncbi:MAG: hypothetical protein QE285_08345 [Aquabacterium sp.]|nr:hypothetical protein [Aquabacterium sp.]
MNLCLPGHAPTAAAAVLALLLAAAPALAGPGAHGPDGEHLDTPAGMRPASALPRVEAQTDAFELVAELGAGTLAILIDRYASNEPVLGARLEVESGPLKAVAAFRAEQGDYAVTNAAMLKALATPGEHGLVFTLVAGADSDLLDGTLKVAAASDAAATADHHEGDHPLPRAAWAGAGLAALALVGGIAWWRSRQRQARTLQVGL